MNNVSSSYSDLGRHAEALKLDEETLALVQRAQPFPVPPPEVPGDEIKFMVPVPR